MDFRLYDVHLLLKPGPLGDNRRMFSFLCPPSSVAHIKTDIKTTVATMEGTYPTTAKLKVAAALDFTPASLRLLLQHVFVGKDTSRKIAGIGQVRPRVVIAPLQLGVAVQMHHLYRSRFLIDSLSTMGFASSYPEVQSFEINAACSLAPDVLGGDMVILGQYLLFVGDNVDHNIITLDGKGTSHGMGMIAAIKPGKQVSHGITRQKTANLKLVEMTKIDIIDYRFRIMSTVAYNFCRSHTHLMSVIESGHFFWKCLFASTRVRPVGKAWCTCCIRSANIRENLRYNFSQW